MSDQPTSTAAPPGYGGLSTLVEQALQPPSPTALPQWMDEPARFIGQVVASLLAVVTTVGALLVGLTGMVPERYRLEVAAVVAGCGTFATLLAKAQAWLTRAKTWAPATVTAAVNEALYTAPPGEMDTLVQVPGELVYTAAPVPGPPPVQSGQADSEDDLSPLVGPDETTEASPV